jgi:hypothetical protein
MLLYKRSWEGQKRDGRNETDSRYQNVGVSKDQPRSRGRSDSREARLFWFSPPHTNGGIVHLVYSLAFGTAPPPTAPVFAGSTTLAAFRLASTPLTQFLTGTTVLVANHGVPHTLNMILSGRRALVIAYAVANSTTTLTPPSLTFHALSLLLISIFASSSASAASSPRIHPFRLKYLPNFSTPESTHVPSENHRGSQWV